MAVAQRLRQSLDVQILVVGGKNEMLTAKAFAAGITGLSPSPPEEHR